MTSILYKIRRLLSPRTRLRTFINTPRLYREHFRYALRQAMVDRIVLPIWVTSPAGTRFYLSDDPIDDKIAVDIALSADCCFPKINGLEPKDGVILNVGGHHGLWASEALRRYPNRELIIVEPHPAWCRVIKRNVEANGGLNRTRVVNACLAEDHRKRSLSFDVSSSWSASVHPERKGSVTIQVQSNTLPDILAGKVPFMIYCNAEGAEYSLVAQLKKENIRPTILIICLHPEYGDGAVLRKNIIAMGYIETDMTKHSKRPIFHYYIEDTFRGSSTLNRGQ